MGFPGPARSAPRQPALHLSRETAVQNHGSSRFGRLAPGKWGVFERRTALTEVAAAAPASAAPSAAPPPDKRPQHHTGVGMWAGQTRGRKGHRPAAAGARPQRRQDKGLHLARVLREPVWPAHAARHVHAPRPCRRDRGRDVAGVQAAGEQPAARRAGGRGEV
jgi:hypothetical protein